MHFAGTGMKRRAGNFQRCRRHAAAGLAAAWLGGMLLASGAHLRGQAAGAASKPPAGARDFSPRWRPKQGGPAGLHYVGAQVCVTCHRYEARELQTPMALASQPAAASPHLRRPLAASFGGDRFQFARAGKQVIYSVTRGGRTVSAPLLWGFGQGVLAQTFVYRSGKNFYEGRISYYTQVRRLAYTMGDAPLPASLPEALGRQLGPDETRKCFVCHTTGSYRGGVFHASQAAAGVTCEGCHGPGSAHVAAMRAHEYARAHIYNPGKLNAGGVLDFCGSCHRTPEMVFNMGVTGIVDIRFQPYRLALSLCWNPIDSRISCLACHDPHQPLVKRAAWYDPKCLACHRHPGERASAGKPGRACPVAQKNCVTCHMPKLALPGAHARFADHLIRIVRPGQGYPG